MTWCCIAFLVKCKTHGAKPLHAKMNKNGCQHLGLGSVGSRAKVKVATQDTHSHTNPHKTGLTVPLMHDCVPQLHLDVHRGTPPGLQTHSKSQQSLCNLFLTSAILLAGLLSFCPAVSYFFQHITQINTRSDKLLLMCSITNDQVSWLGFAAHSPRCCALMYILFLSTYKDG